MDRNRRVMPFSRSLFKPARWVGRSFVALLMLVLPFLVYAVHTFSQANFHAVVPGVA